MTMMNYGVDASPSFKGFKVSMVSVYLCDNIIDDFAAWETSGIEEVCEISMLIH